MGKTKLFLRDKELETLDNVSKNVAKKIIKAQAGIVFSEKLEMIMVQQKNVKNKYSLGRNLFPEIVLLIPL